MKQSSLVLLAMLMLVGCGNDGDSNSSGTDAGSDGGELSDTMGSCQANEWRRTTDMSCQTCPAAQLECSSLNADATAIDVTAETVAVTLETGLTSIDSATLVVTEARRSCQGGGGGGAGSDCINVTEADLELDAAVDANELSFTVTPADDTSNWIQLQEIQLIDTCGDEHVIGLAGEWYLDRGDNVEVPLQCD